MTHKVGPKGQVVIPKNMREELGIEAGDEVVFEMSEDHVEVRPVAGSGGGLRGRYRDSDLIGILERERRKDRQREDRE